MAAVSSDSYDVLTSWQLSQRCHGALLLMNRIGKQQSLIWSLRAQEVETPGARPELVVWCVHWHMGRRLFVYVYVVWCLLESLFQYRPFQSHLVITFVFEQPLHTLCEQDPA